MLEEVGGDLIAFSKAQYIAHQCNCVTTDSAGIARAIFTAFPHANIYAERKNSGTKSKPGTIDICGNGDDERPVINLFAQYYPGKAKYDNDSAEKRIEWMKQCLAKIYNMRDQIKSIAFPHGMGCNLAGGDWEIYRSMIKKLADNMPDTTVYIVKKFEKDIESSEMKRLGKIENNFQENCEKLNDHFGKIAVAEYAAAVSERSGYIQTK